MSHRYLRQILSNFYLLDITGESYFLANKGGTAIPRPFLDGGFFVFE